MRKRIAAFLGTLAFLFAFATAPVGAVAGDHGTFWVFDGANGTGQWRGFDVYPNRTQTFSPGATTKYTGNCPGGVCGYLNNTISSIELSCGVSGFVFHSTDWIDFYNLDIPSGTAYRITTALAACSNGVRTINFDSAHNNWAGSMVTHDG